MDNLTHSLVGWALAETGLKHRSRKGVAACILAANMPDIDVFFGWSPWAPLAMHRGFTHGLVGGVLLMPPVLAGLLWLLDRWQLRRGRIADDAPAIHLGWLMALSWLGAITHPLLDMQNTYAVQLLAPATARWFHTDGLFIVSPWLLAFLGTGVWAARRSGKGRPAVAALAASVTFILVNIAISALAWEAPRHDAPYATPDRIFASPEPLLFWRRDVVWRQDGMITQASYDPLRRPFGLISVSPSFPDNMADPAARLAAQATPRVVKYLSWAQLPVAEIVRQRCSTTVTFSDGRFGGPYMSRRMAVSATVPVHGINCGA